MAKSKLTAIFIDNIQLPVKMTEYPDHKKQGLKLRVNPSGKKSFYYRYYLNSKYHHYKIGDYPDISLSGARDEVAELAYKVSKGINPNEEKKRQQVEAEQRTTFSEVAARFEKYNLPQKKEKTQADYSWGLRKYLTPEFGDTPIIELRRRDISNFLEEIAEEHPTLANRLQALLSVVINYAVEKEYLDSNPIYKLRKKGQESSRDRILTDQEIRSVWQAIEQQSEPIRSIFKILLLCGQRSGETKAMQWDHIQDGSWSIPAHLTKKSTNKAKDHQVPLWNFASEIINSQKTKSTNKTYVFASDSNRAQDDAPVKWLHKAIERIRQESGVEDFTIHDLRRTVASNLAELGYDRTVIGKVLNHADTAQDRSVTAIYDQHSYFQEKKYALNDWAKKLRGLVDSNKSA